MSYAVNICTKKSLGTIGVVSTDEYIAGLKNIFDSGRESEFGALIRGRGIDHIVMQEEVHKLIVDEIERDPEMKKKCKCKIYIEVEVEKVEK